jgi:DNA-binding CsgD family transcriptional regulator
MTRKKNAFNLHYCSLFYVFCLFFTSINGAGQQQMPYVIRNFEKQEYNAESQNWSVTQDNKGFIYVANNSGLLEFDGVEWSFYPSPRGTVIRSVAVDNHNRIYTSGYMEIGYWQRDELGKLVYHSLNPQAEALFSQNEEFWTTVIVENRVYFHSFSSIFIYDEDEFRVIRANAFINSVSDIGGRLCLHISGQGLLIAEDSILVPFLEQPELRNDLVHFCTTMEDSSLLIGTASNGLFRYKDNELTPFTEEWNPYFSENKINRGAISTNGNIVIGTLLDGIVIFDQQGKFLHHISKINGLQNNTVLGIHFDGENNIWLSLDQGVDYISFQLDPSFTIYEYADIGAVYSAALYRGDLYLGTNQGLFYRKWEDSEDNFKSIAGTQGQVWSCDVFDDQLIVGHNLGTFRIEDHVAERISPISGGFSLTRDPLKSELLVQSTYSNIVFYELQNQKWQYKYQLPDFLDLIRYIEPDYFDNIWASHMHKGIYRLKLNDSHETITDTRYYGDAVFGEDFDIQVFKIENRIVFTTGRQLYTYNDLNDSIIPHSHLNNELGIYAEAHRIIPGDDHHYWFIGKQGIGLFRIADTGISKIKEYPIGLFRDHIIAGYEYIYPLSSTEGLLCLDNGYAVLRADRPDLSFGIEDKQLMVKNIEIKGRSGVVQNLPLKQNTIRIPYNSNSLILSYAFPIFSHGAHSFQSFIEGLDAAWSDPLDKPYFEFTRIPTGEYTVRVRAFNVWNRGSVENRITLIVSPPWYLHWGSIITYVVMIITLLLTARYLLIQRIRLREKKIKETKEKELIRLRNEKLNADLSFKSQELANSTMAIIKKNEFLLELKETLKSQKEDLGTRFPEKHYSRLVRKIDNNISSMDDWKVFEFHFEKAHEKFLHKLINKYPQLSHSDLRLCAYLRMNLTSKEIAPLLRISYRGVENHRYKLRKKLLLKKEVNLTDFILAL